MKFFSSVLMVFNVLISSMNADDIASATNPPPMLVASYSKNAVYVVDEAGKVIWALSRR